MQKAFIFKGFRMTKFARNRDSLEYMFSLPEYSNMMYNTLTVFIKMSRTLSINYYLLQNIIRK
nr:MAG TPA: hypothetical protein [Caudoviricetes sp.]